MIEYTPVIGLEVHVQLATKSKMFSRCSADWFGKPPNSVVCPVSLGLPGALPVPNKQAIEWTILIGMALNGKINKVSKFDRKHYFYPDLPKGYQISQYDQPFCCDGYYEFISKASDETKRIRIRRVHLEEDTGKLIHDGADTLVDFNRAGVPLVEIVTEPDFDNADDVKQFLEELQVFIRYLGVSDADMEKGSMRLEPNISLRKTGEKKLPSYKVEVKNINSFKFAKAAIDYEVIRHAEILRKGEVPHQETRGYNEAKAFTVSQRRKEEAADYRYFPEPDTPPFVFDDAFLKNIRDRLPELPQLRIKRYIGYGLSAEDARVLTRDKLKCDHFEKLLKKLTPEAQSLRFKSKSLEAEVAKLVINKKINPGSALDMTVASIKKMLTPSDTDMAKLKEIVKKVLDDNKKAVDAYKKGKESVLMFFVGQVMKEMQGQADAIKVQEVVRIFLENVQGG